MKECNETLYSNSGEMLKETFDGDEFNNFDDLPIGCDSEIFHKLLLEGEINL